MFRSAAPRALVLAALALAAAACADHNPAGPRVHPPEIAPPVHAALRCRMDVRAETLACGPATPETAPGVSPLIIGGQGINVRLRSSGTSYDAGTAVFRSEVTVENLMAQALGTDDGVFPAPQGVRVFFHTGPTVSKGSGQVSVANPDGEAAFTAGMQPFFQYAGLLAPGDTSAAREWRFNVPNSVEFFEFTVLVSAPVQGETTPSAALFILAGTGVTDTVDAEPSSILRVGVRGTDGKPAANTMVQVETVTLPGTVFEREVLVAPAGGRFYTYAYTYTDSMGIAEFQAKMGTRAGPGRLVVSAPVVELWDTVSYTILPGKVGQVRSLPADTVVLVGGRAPLRVGAYDRHGNALGDTVALSVAGGPGTVEGVDVVTGSSIGMVTAVATAGGFSDTSVVRVVPRATVAAPARGMHSGQTGGIYTFSLDGSNLRRVHSTISGPGYGAQLSAAWLSPTKLVYHDVHFGQPYENRVSILDLATGESARLLAPADRLENESFPRPTPDGSWVYFTGGTHSRYHVHRARADGSEAERVSVEDGVIRNEWGADPSPDGTRIAFLRGNGGFNDEYLNLMDLATREVTSLDVLGVSPRWSPDGTRIAYAGEPIHSGWRLPGIMNADGTGARTLSQTPMWGDISWSPDGKYLIFSSPVLNNLVIIDVATGAEVVVRIPGIVESISSPVWKP